MDFTLYDTLDQTQTHILLCRHARRYEITDFTRSTEALLTPRGKSEARRRGRRLAGRFSAKTIFHSPVRRCAQTAAELARGLRDKKEASTPGGALDWLGGDFIRTTAPYVNDYMAVHGWQVFLRRWFDGGLPEERILPPRTAAPVELNLLKQQLAAQRGLVIDVTHDWNIMLLLEHYFKLRFEAEGLPDFLEAVIVSPAPAGRVRLAYRGNTVETG
jgi:hypothetical protein